MKYKIIIFVIASGFAGLVGSFMAHYFHAISPDGFSFDLGMQVVVFMLVGGATSVAGPIVGVVALELLSHFLRSFGQAYEVIAYGIALVVVIMFVPGGLISVPQRLLELSKRLVGAGRLLLTRQSAGH